VRGLAWGLSGKTKAARRGNGKMNGQDSRRMISCVEGAGKRSLVAGKKGGNFRESVGHARRVPQFAGERDQKRRRRKRKKEKEKSTMPENRGGEYRP